MAELFGRFIAYRSASKIENVEKVVIPVSILENIQSHQDIKILNSKQRTQLCKEIREFLVKNVSQTGGHVSSNMGVVELTVALETVFDTAVDRLVFDVGHQSYIHKLLTGRQEAFSTLRQFGGMAGFPKPSESITDAFVAGHASSSVSIALGMARARTLQNEQYDIVALIGDGAATGGMAYEGLSDAAVSKEPIVIVLNDNALSIDQNVGGMASHLRQLRSKEKYWGIKKSYRKLVLKLPCGRYIYRFTHNIKDRVRRMLIPTTIFESMGFVYLGPVDGHDTEQLITLLRIGKEMRCPVLIHVMTQKGRGYAPSEEHPKLFHGIGKFDPVSGVPLKKSEPTFSDIFGKTMVDMAADNKKLCAITAAMPGGTGLLEFKQKYPDRLFDVGIAEEHAVSMAGGLAKQGMTPVVALYSTFLQRAYDMILQDICMLNLPVIFAVDRAGLVGEDGETHHGIYDIGFLRHAPGMQILCPGSLKESEEMLRWAVETKPGPVAIRYPRGGNRFYAQSSWKDGDESICVHRKGNDLTIVTYGTLLNNAMIAAQILSERGIEATVLRIMRINPIDMNELVAKSSSKRRLFVAEEVSGNCGIREHITASLKCTDEKFDITGIDLGNQYITHGAVDKLYDYYGLSPEKLVQTIMEVYSSEN